jgi:hypothetical protein
MGIPTNRVKRAENKKEGIVDENEREGIVHENEREGIVHENKREGIVHENKREGIADDGDGREEGRHSVWEKSDERIRERVMRGSGKE